MLKKVSDSYKHTQELVRIVSKFGDRHAQLPSITTLNNSENEYAKLYRGINQQVGKDEDETIMKSLGMKQSHSYRVLRDHLKVLLTNRLFTLDLDGGGYSKYSQHLFGTNRAVFITRVLHALNAQGLAVRTAKHALPVAIRIEEWSSALELLSILRSNAALEGNNALHESLSTQFQLCKDIYMAEQRAETLMEQVQLRFSTSTSEKPSFAEEVIRESAMIAEVAKMYKTFKLSFLVLRLKSACHQIELNYNGSLDVCDRADELLKRYPLFSNRARRAEYAIKRLYCSLQLRNNSLAARAVQDCEKLLTQDEDNWFSFKEYHFLWLMHSQQFAEAMSLIDLVILHARFEMQTAAQKERWNLFKFYGEYVNNRPLPVTEVNEFLCFVPSYSRDKAGFNLAVLTLHILLLLDKEDKEGLINRVEALRIYRRRYLNREENSQARHFFRLIILLEECSFEYPAVIRRMAHLREQMMQSPHGKIIEGVQVLPYDWLWIRILEKLRISATVDDKTQKRAA